MCFVIGVGSEFAVSDVCSDGCDLAWGRGVSVGARGVCVGGKRSTGGVYAADACGEFVAWNES